jgi:hypothetical protein
MAFAHGPGLDLCPRLKALTDRHLFLPRGYEVPQILKPICEASLDLSQVPVHWDRWVHLIASAYSGHTSAINVLARFGSAARGDPLYEVGVVIGRLLRTAFLADYFVNPAFRRGGHTRAMPVVPAPISSNGNAEVLTSEEWCSLSQMFRQSREPNSANALHREPLHKRYQ